MGFDLRLDMKMSQQLVMTPQLQQAIKLLQLSRMDLIDAVRDELMDNPLLEENSEISASEVKVESAQEVAQREKLTEAKDVELTDQVETAKEQIDWESYFENYSSPTPGTSGQRLRDDDMPGYEATLTRTESLFDHLMWQLQVSDFNTQEERVAVALIGNINDDGYLKGLDPTGQAIDGDEIIQMISYEVENDIEYVEEVLELVQGFDPPGVGARNLKECLLVQARLSELGAIVEDIIKDHLIHLESRNFPAISKAMDIEMEEVSLAADLITDLEPRPGRPFTIESARYITPDIFIKKQEDGSFKAALNEDGMPRLKISQFYRNALRQADSSETKKYVTEKLNSAAFLIRSIQQRQKTIVKVTESIIKFQGVFLEHGVEALRPLILRDVADDIEMHESTVSRVTSNKYVHTPQGIFELKYFFNSSIQGDQGDLASEAVKSKIKGLISKEDLKKTLSDQKIADILKESGVNIARRTVAKYRESMNILPSSRRKRLF
jgi:RNA polymerase sigma-54 factor